MRSDRWISTEQEGETLYAEQATRGPRICEFLTTPRGRISPYLDFIPILSVLSMFRLNEAVRGRLIGPKTWDRIYRNF